MKIINLTKFSGGAFMRIPVVEMLMAYTEHLLGYNDAVIIKHFMMLLSGIFIGVIIMFFILSKLLYGLQYREKELGEGILALKGTFKDTSTVRICPPRSPSEALDCLIAIVWMQLRGEDDIIFKDVKRFKRIVTSILFVLFMLSIIGILFGLDVFV